MFCSAGHFFNLLFVVFVNPGMKLIAKYWIPIVIVFGICMFIKPPLCALILGTVAILTAIEMIRTLKRFSEFGLGAIGKITSFEIDDEGYKTPVIEFIPPGGELMKNTPMIWGSSDVGKLRSFKSMLDTEVAIKYDPDEPSRFIVMEEKSFTYFMIVMLFIIGSVFLTLSIATLTGYADMFNTQPVYRVPHKS
jgi:hypothetical protein